MASTDTTKDTFTETDLTHLRRTIELAKEALEAGDAPFGSVLVYNNNDDNTVKVREDRNRDKTLNDGTRHPEFELARWAATSLTPEQRERAVVYTSGEHCAMCAAAHAWVGLGEIVYVASSRQLEDWVTEFGKGEGEGEGEGSPVAMLPVQKVAPRVRVRGPAPKPELVERIKALHRRYFETNKRSV